MTDQLPDRAERTARQAIPSMHSTYREEVRRCLLCAAGPGYASWVSQGALPHLGRAL